ncbi:recombinase family protein [Streptomyces acidiscabies]|uniref:recombinase family protein n=1 Tax=Streptomyces acidiscabies TaxID=42234 RepID=UPI00076EA7E7|nr:recombinase family protein [Streptomyces acidiscabies]GAQ55194.1 hypothetical protein a10_05016 [Streptomyces acidiscabies]
MDVFYEVGCEGSSKEDRNQTDVLLRRQEAFSLLREPARSRIALQECISLIRLGVANHLHVPDESHLQDPVTRAVACAAVLAAGGEVTIGTKPVMMDDELLPPQELAFEAAREQYRLLPPTTESEGTHAYISRGWQSDEECARLAHKLVHEMRYSQAYTARIIEAVDGFDRPAMWTKQGLNRKIWQWEGKERIPRYNYHEVSGTEARRPGRLHLPAASFDAMAVLGDEQSLEEARNFDAALAKPHLGALPLFNPRHQERSVARLLRQIMESGFFRTLYVANPETVFSTEIQRRVVYDLALFRGVQVVEDGVQINAVDNNPRYNRLLRESTELFAALWIRDSATVLEESRSMAHAQQKAAELRSKGRSLRNIAAELQAEAIPTKSGKGSWSPSMVRELLDEKE